MPQTNIETISVSAQAEDQAERAGGGSPDRARPTVPTAVNEPIVKTSPWAKLISSMIP